MHILEYFCNHGHRGTFEFDSEIAAEIKGAYVRGGVCEVCGAGGLGVRISEVEKPKAAKAEQLAALDELAKEAEVAGAYKPKGEPKKK